MNQYYYEQLARVYNTMTLISTKGQDTLYMAECLKALKEIYENIDLESDKIKEEN